MSLEALGSRLVGAGVALIAYSLSGPTLLPHITATAAVGIAFAVVLAGAALGAIVWPR